jgi:hypothetical protein
LSQLFLRSINNSKLVLSKSILELSPIEKCPHG